MRRQAAKRGLSGGDEKNLEKGNRGLLAENQASRSWTRAVGMRTDRKGFCLPGGRRLALSRQHQSAYSHEGKVITLDRVAFRLSASQFRLKTHDGIHLCEDPTHHETGRVRIATPMQMSTLQISKGGSHSKKTPQSSLRGFGGRADVPPLLSSAAIWSPIPQLKEIGREEAIYGRANHRLSA